MSLEVVRLTASHEGRILWNDVDLSVATATTLAVRGPSGCGKTTLLRCIAGLHRPDAGSIVVDGIDLTDVPTHRRSIGLVFQDDQLFPHLDVFENVAFGLRLGRFDEATVMTRVGEMLELVGLDDLARRSVGSLSGGEAKRVALARSLAPTPRVLLLDEPFAGLDAERRLSLGRDLKRILGETRTTVVLVSHDRDDVANVADEIFDLTTP